MLEWLVRWRRDRLDVRVCGRCVKSTFYTPVTPVTPITVVFTDTDCGGHCSPCEPGAACAVPADCLYVSCEGSQCVVPAKGCVNNCTGHGKCVRTDVTGARLEARECVANDWSCAATCECHDEWFDSDCSLDSEGYAEVSALRSSLLDSLDTATEMQDTTKSAMNQQATSLLSISAAPLELSGDASMLALALVDNLVSASTETGFSTGTDTAVGGTVSNLIETDLLVLNTTIPTASSPPATAAHTTSARRRHPLLAPPTMSPTAWRVEVSTTTALMDTIGMLSQAQLRDSVAGEAGPEIDTPNVMMSSTRVFSIYIADASLSPPSNAGGGKPELALDVPTDPGNTAAATDTKVLQFGTNIYSGADGAKVHTNSPLVALSAQRAGSDRRRLEQADSTLTLILENIRPIDHDATSETTYINLTCAPFIEYRVIASCPGTNATISTNCTGEAGESSKTIACYSHVVPTCLVWSDMTQTYDSDVCRLVNYTATNTSCSCKADASAWESTVAFTSGSQALLNYFADTFDAPFGPALLAKNALLLYTYLVVFILALLNIAEGYRRDLRDSSGTWTMTEAGKARSSATGASGPLKSVHQLREDIGLDNEKLTADETSRRNIKAWSEASLPAFVSDKTVCHTVFHVMMDGHSWLNASGVGPFSPVTPRPTRTILFAIEIIWLMCSEALAFQFCYADIGCATYTTQELCERVKNPYVRFV